MVEVEDQMPVAETSQKETLANQEEEIKQILQSHSEISGWLFYWSNLTILLTHVRVHSQHSLPQIEKKGLPCHFDGI